MAVVTQEVMFEGMAPGPAAIETAIARLGGLPATLTEDGPGIKGDLYDLHGRLAFACGRSNSIEIFSYSPGAVRRHYEQMSAGAPAVLGRQLQGMTGLDESPGHQSIHLRAILGQELTIFTVAALALESLGGRIRRPIPEEARLRCAGPMTREALDRRVRKARWVAFGGMVLFVVLLPVTLVRLVLWAVFVMPVRLWKARRSVVDELQKDSSGIGSGTTTGSS